MLPIEALTTLGSNISTPGLIMAISFIPKPRQERSMVPKLPMSDGFTKTTWSLLASKYEEYFLNKNETKFRAKQLQLQRYYLLSIIY